MVVYTGNSTKMAFNWGFNLCYITWVLGLVFRPPQVDRIWGIKRSYYNILTAIFYLLKGGYRVLGWMSVLLCSEILASGG